MIAFVLPTKNEAPSIGGLVDELKSIAASENWDIKIIVVDDSTDETAKIAQTKGAIVIDGGRVGLGQAMVRGLSLALQLDPEWVVSLDTDGQVDCSELPRFFNAAIKQNVDVVTSSRFLSTEIDYPYPLVNWIGNRILVGILRLATMQKFTDSHGGIRWMRADSVRSLSLIGRHTYVQETLIQMRRRGFRILEIPSRWKAREHGESRVLESIGKYVFRTLPALSYWLGGHVVIFIAGITLAFFGRYEWSILFFIISILIGSLPLFALKVADVRS